MQRQYPNKIQTCSEPKLKEFKTTEMKRKWVKSKRHRSRAKERGKRKGREREREREGWFVALLWQLWCASSDLGVIDGVDGGDVGVGIRPGWKFTGLEPLDSSGSWIFGLLTCGETGGRRIGLHGLIILCSLVLERHHILSAAGVYDGVFLDLRLRDLVFVQALCCLVWVVGLLLQCSRYRVSRLSMI